MQEKNINELNIDQMGQVAGGEREEIHVNNGEGDTSRLLTNTKRCPRCGSGNIERDGYEFRGGYDTWGHDGYVCNNCGEVFAYTWKKA